MEKKKTERAEDGWSGGDGSKGGVQSHRKQGDAAAVAAADNRGMARSA
jgi:hypothetical protein